MAKIDNIEIETDTGTEYEYLEEVFDYSFLNDEIEKPVKEWKLTENNYYSKEANKRYMSVHQYLNFAGGMLGKGCEARAMEELEGRWEEPMTDALLVGSYVDSHFEGTLPKFKNEHKEIFTQRGSLKAQFTRAEKMIRRCEQDEYFMRYMSGKKQVVMTGWWAGCDWKIKIDSYIEDVAIVDLKTSADIHRAWRIPDGGYASFIEAFNYDKQLAVYQKIVEINTGKKLPCYIAVVTKEDSPEIKIIHIDQFTLDNALNVVEMNMPSVLAVKNKEIQPIRCGKCDFCKATEKLTKPISYRDLIIQE